MARASILWLMGEYCERVPKIAPDVLRKMAKTFTAEEDIVKLQTVNLAAKLYLTNSKQVGKRISSNSVPAGWNWTMSKYCAGLTEFWGSLHSGHSKGRKCSRANVVPVGQISLKGKVMQQMNSNFKAYFFFWRQFRLLTGTNWAQRWVTSWTTHIPHKKLRNTVLISKRK